jgi:hypothetical protein
MPSFETYLTQGVIDITPLIRHQAPGMVDHDHVGSIGLPDAEDVTVAGSETTQSGSGDGERHDTPGDEPPRAGRSRSPRPKPYIPVGTQPSVPDNQPCCYEPDRPCERHTEPERRAAWGKRLGEAARRQRQVYADNYAAAQAAGTKAYGWAHAKVLWETRTAYSLPRVTHWPAFEFPSVRPRP